MIFTINEGEKGAISAVRFEGNTMFSDRILRKQMKTKGKTLIRSSINPGGSMKRSSSRTWTPFASGIRTTATSMSK